MSEATRRYRSTRRAEQSAETRRDIVAAARRLFAGGGYSTTSMDRIASEAGVAVQTIYATFGSKLALLAALNEVIDAEGGVVATARQMMREDDPRTLIGMTARLGRQLNERFGDIMRTVYFAANADPAAAGIWAEGMRRHRLGTARTAQRIASLAALRPELTLERATDIVDFLTSPQSFFHLVGDLGWSYDECEAWITDTMCQLLLPAQPDGDAPT